MSLPDAGKTNLEKRENGSTSDNSNYVGYLGQGPNLAAADIRLMSDTEKNSGLARSTSLPELKAVASNALSRTVSRLTNRDIVDPGPAPGKATRIMISTTADLGARRRS